MVALGLTEQEANRTVDLLVKNLHLGGPNINRCSVIHLGRQYFAVVERSEAMEWIWYNFPDFRCVTVYEYVVVELETIRQAALCKLRWC